MRDVKWTIQIGVLEADNGWSRERDKDQLRIKLKHYRRFGHAGRVGGNQDIDSISNPLGNSTAHSSAAALTGLRQR